MEDSNNTCQYGISSLLESMNLIPLVRNGIFEKQKQSINCLTDFNIKCKAIYFYLLLDTSKVEDYRDEINDSKLYQEFIIIPTDDKYIFINSKINNKPLEFKIFTKDKIKLFIDNLNKIINLYTSLEEKKQIFTKLFNWDIDTLKEWNGNVLRDYFYRY